MAVEYKGFPYHMLRTDTVRGFANSALDLYELKAAIGRIKGIGESRLNEIMNVIQSFMDKAEE